MEETNKEQNQSEEIMYPICLDNLQEPILQNEDDVFPKNPICPICKKNRIFEPNSFAILTAGALLVDRETNSSGPDDNLNGFLNLVWHGAHSNYGGQGIHPEVHYMFDIFYDVKGGQGSLYFCSPQCLRQFLNYCVDKLEEGIQKRTY
jgi:hypothetical protein